MSGLQLLDITACAVIFSWACWCVYSRRVKDGIYGKVLYSLAALSALAVAIGSEGRNAAMTLHLAFALLGLRHVTLKFFWPRIVRAARCAMCPKNDNHKGQ